MITQFRKLPGLVIIISLLWVKAGISIEAVEKPYIPDIETFMQIGYCASPAISEDGREIFFISNMSSVSQLYRLTEEGWPYQLTLFSDGIDFYTISPDGEFAIVGASTGGSEQSQLHWVDGKTGRTRILTRKPEVRYGTVVISPTKNHIYYRSNERNMTDFDIYAMNLGTGEEVMLAELEGANGVEDITDDGKALLFSRWTSSYNSDLYFFDIDSRQRLHLTPHKGEAVYDYPEFSPDGHVIYLVTNENKEGLLRVAKIEVATRRIEYLHEETVWETEELALSPEGRYIAWVLNQDGYGNLYIKDLQAGEMLPTPPLSGLVTEPYFARDGKLLFVFESPTKTEDVWSWDLHNLKLQKLTNSIYAGIDPSLFVEPQLIRYKTFDKREIPGLLYLPPTYSGEPIPFIVHAHGGPESQFRPSFYRHLQYLLLNGYGIFAPNVRGSSGYGKDYAALDNYKKRLDSVKDLKCGVDWLIQKGYTKKRMIGIKGASYGGYMVLAGITEYPDLFAAAVDEVGIANFVTFLENTGAYRRALREAEYGPLTDRGLLKEISPIHKVDRITTPLMVVHGENDPRVPVGEARQIIKALSDRGVAIDSLIFADEGHGVSKRKNNLILYRRMVDFFDKHLKEETGNRGQETGSRN
jgi:dipeptidyl aminopeptidase/acylaminoacyl peptidase